jgi:hypothetical protein
MLSITNAIIPAHIVQLLKCTYFFIDSHSILLVTYSILQLAPNRLKKGSIHLSQFLYEKATWNMVLANHRSLMGQTTRNRNPHVIISSECWLVGLKNLPPCHLPRWHLRGPVPACWSYSRLSGELWEGEYIRTSGRFEKFYKQISIRIYYGRSKQRHWVPNQATKWWWWTDDR